MPVNNQISTPLTSAAPIATLPASLRIAGTILLGTAFLAACAHIAIPLWFTPIPLTLQPFGVLVLGLLLSPRLAAGTLAAYLAEGALGLPVFSPAAAPLAGIAHLLGPTGGYLLAYPAAALLIALLSRRLGRSFTASLVSATLGDLLILLCGALWLAGRSHAALPSTFALAVLPFLPGEALKISAAAGLARGWQKLRK
ncbi:MAG TPA: biotin transporter BioY [Terracidiphilus sp.]|jgi:biotin transport system substrate-specific component|nr:biotin transporter BioY [Terracidiphilus sp.]